MKTLSECNFTATSFDRDQLSNLIKVLKESGFDIHCELSASGKTAQLSFHNIPSSYEAQIKRTRRAGRRTECTYIPRNSIFNKDTELTEVLAWIDEHSVAEAMSELGVNSKSTYFRRVKLMREKVAYTKEYNAAHKEPKPPFYKVYQLPEPALRDCKFA